MKIKFVKDYKAFMGIENPFNSRYDYEAGEIKDANDETAQWLIDNGFAEEAKEPSLWEPKCGERYYYIDGSGCCITPSNWEHTGFDAWHHDIGNVFKTYEAAVRYRDYLEAIEAIRRDEGFMTPSREAEYAPCGYGVYPGYDKSAIVEPSDTTVSAGEFYFDTYEHAESSIEKHGDEWQTILSYDWGKE